jgi:hypothetical protein
VLDMYYIVDLVGIDRCGGKQAHPVRVQTALRQCRSEVAFAGSKAARCCSDTRTLVFDHEPQKLVIPRTRARRTIACEPNMRRTCKLQGGGQQRAGAPS